MTRAPRAARAVDWRFAGLVLGLVLILGLFGRIAGTDPDEEYALASTAHGLGYALHRAIYYELQAPVWFGLIALWRSVDPSVAFARLFSIACAAGTCLALRSIALRIRPRIDPLAFVALAVLNPFFMYAALEVRVYAFAMLLSALSWLAFYDGYLAGEDRGARIRFALLALLSIYTFYYLAFVLVGCGAALLAARRFRAFGAFVPLALGLALASAPALLAIRATFSDVRAALPPLAGTSFGSFVDTLLLFVMPSGYRWPDPLGLGSLLRHAYKPLLLLIAVALVAARLRLAPREFGIVALALVTWLVYPLVYFTIHVRLQVPRHYVTLFVPVAAATYTIVTGLSAPWRRFATGLFVAGYAACCLLCLWGIYGPLSKAGDMRRVGAYVSAHAAANDVVAVFAPDAKPAFLRFYAGAAPVVSFPREPDPERYDTSLYEVHSVADAEAGLARVAAGRRLWLVLYGGCEPQSENYGCSDIKTALRERYPDATVVDFYDTEVVEAGVLPARKNAGRSPARGISRASGERPDSRQKKAALSAIASE